MDKMQIYRYVGRMIFEAGHDDFGIPERFFDENFRSRESIYYYIRSVIAEEYSEHDGAMNNQTGYQIIVDAVAGYLDGRSAPISVRHNVYQHLYSWCKMLGQKYNIDDYDMYLNDIPKPNDEDFVIGLIKNLHGRDGITKSELAGKMNKSKRAVQANIHRLSGDDPKNPLRIGGFSVKVPVEYKEEKYRDEHRRFYTPNTMHPIVYQLNLMQTASLLQAFMYSYDMDNNIPLDLAIDTWCQLSDYAKNRIKEIFCLKDDNFAEFIDIVEDESDNSYRHFMTEAEMLNDEKVSPGEQLDLAFKGGRKCDLYLNSPFRTRTNCIIGYDRGRHCYYAVNADDIDGDKLYFTLDEFEELQTID